MFEHYFLAFVSIFVAVDAVGMLPIFMALTHRFSPEERRRLVWNSTVTALLVAISFLWIGKLVFQWLGITINDFLVAGGAILFIISIRDLLSFEKSPRVPGETLGVVPLAVPLIVGPAVLTTSLILHDSFGFYPTVTAIVLNILLCAVILNASQILSKILGVTGSHTLSKIFNLLLAAIGVMLIRSGVFKILSDWKPLLAP
jgi:multiple antibiotic resistance protein